MAAQAAGQGGQSLSDLVTSLGHQVDPLLAEVEEAAGSAQLLWHGPTRDPTVEIHRSTTLWAILQEDSGLRADLNTAGLGLEDLSKLLGLPQHATGLADETVVVSPNLSRAIAEYLRPVVDGSRTIGPFEVAEAILLSCRDTSAGRLPGWLRDLGVDLEAAIAAMRRERIRVSYSQSVHGLAERLATTPLTASRIAQELQLGHDKYGEGTFGSVALDPDDGPVLLVEEWLDRVQGLYDVAQVGASAAQVIDGRMLLLGLAELDSPLEDSLRRDGFLRRLRRETALRPRQVRSDQTEWATDEPAGEDSEDHLGRRFLADVLARRLIRLDREGTKPFLVHLDGPWGSGKSTVFRLLERRLGPHFLVVRVNAWREQHVGVQWWTLHQALRNALRNEARFAIAADAKAFWDVARTRWLQVVGVLGALLLAAGLLLLTDLTQAGFVADLIVKLASVGALLVAGWTALHSFLLPHSRRSAKTYVDSSAHPMADVSQLFARSLDRAPKPVVFLIDDLDRCEEEYVVGFLEAVQTLVREASARAHKRGEDQQTRKGPYGFVAADGQWLRSSYENKYAASRLTGIPGRPLGYLFLEKIFQLRVRLPSITDQGRDAFYASLLRRAAPTQTERAEQARRVDAAKQAVESARTGDALSRITEQASGIDDPQERLDVLGAAAVRFADLAIDLETESELLPFGRLLEPNPRSMKLFVNHVNILRSLRLLEGVRVDTEILALWTIVEIRWPLLADHLRAHPEHVDGRAAGAPDEIADLLEMDDVRDVVLASEWGPLTTEQIRMCTGAVV